MPSPYDRINPKTGRPFSEAEMAFNEGRDGVWPQGGMPTPKTPKPVSPMSGNNSSVRPADRAPLGGATGEWDLSKFRALAPRDLPDMPWGDNGQAFADMYAPKPKTAAPRSTPNPASPAPAPAAPPVNPFAPPMDTRDPGISAYDRPADDWYRRGGDPSELRMEAGTDFGFGTPGPEDPSWYAEQGKKAPRPDRGFLQSLSDGIGDAMTSVDQYVKDTPNLLQLGINMMAAANAPSKSEQWQQFAGSFDKFGQANRVDEDRKLEKEDRALRMEDRLREIERQKVADARAAEEAARQSQQFDWTKDDRARVVKDRNSTRAARETAIAAEQNPRRKQFLMSLTDDNYGVLMAEEYMAEEAARRAREQDDRNRSRNKEDRAAEREDERTARREEGMFAMGMSYLDNSNKVLPSMQATVADLNRMEQIVNRLTEVGAQGGIIGGDLKMLTEKAKAMTAGRQEGYDEVVGLITEFENLQSNIVAERAQALKPVSNADFSYFAKVSPNASMPTSGALAIIRDLRDSINWDIGTNNFATNFLQTHGGLSGVLVDGKTWIELRGIRPTLNTNAYGKDRGGSTPAPTQRAQGDLMFGVDPAKQTKLEPKVGEKKTVDGVTYMYVGGSPSDPNRANNPKNWQTVRAPATYTPPVKK